jgi:excisionase family DNA binding protein
MEDPNGSGVERLLLSPEEAAEVLGVTRSTIYDLMRMRLLVSIKIGRRRLVPVKACRDLVDRMMAESA